ncbi:MAG: ATP-binding protein [Lachnospiraceae bacterium]
MLCQFAFRNFKSFKNEAFLDFYAEPITDNNESLIIDSDGEKFLPVASIYGPNGGGKSTVLEALGFLRQTIVKPVIASKMNEDISIEEKQILSTAIEETSREKYHKFDKACEQIPIEFEIQFRTKDKEYRYEISILKSEITKENLYYRPLDNEDVIIVFERTGEECVVGEDVKFISVEKVKASLPLLSHLASSYDIRIIDDALSWFLSILFLDYDNPISDKRIMIPKKPKEKTLFFSMFKEMDINISDLRIEEDGEGEIKDIFCKHIIDGEEFELKIQEESSGTRKIFSCLARINNCLQTGQVLIADELDAKLHPKLLRFIIELFTNPFKNEHGAQLLITSHDMINMNPEVFRRDEIWFCALNASNASNLYSLIAFKEENGKPPRKDAIYGKRYLEGKYGADPYIRKGLNYEPKTQKSKRNKKRASKIERKNEKKEKNCTG